MPRPTSYRSQRRRDHDNAPPLLWQDRDTDILELVYTCRFATRELILTALPPAAPPAHIQRRGTPKQPGTNLDRRLAKLFHHGYLDRLRPFGIRVPLEGRTATVAGPLVYALTRKGGEALFERREDLIEQEAALGKLLTRWDERNRTARPSSIDHTLALARFRIALGKGGAEAIFIDRYHREGKNLKAEWTTVRGRRFVVPDAFVVLSDERGDQPKPEPLFVEIDRSTMPLTPREGASSMSAKYEAYAALYKAGRHRTHYGTETVRVLTVCKSEQRAENLRQLVRGEFVPPYRKQPLKPDIRSDQLGLFYFTSEEHFADSLRDVYSSIWTRGSDAKPEPARVSFLVEPLPKLA